MDPLDMNPVEMITNANNYPEEKFVPLRASSSRGRWTGRILTRVDARRLYAEMDQRAGGISCTTTCPTIGR